MLDVVIFRLKRLWAFDPENLPNEDAICARCGHAFKHHLFSGELRSCMKSIEVESVKNVSFFKRCPCKQFLVDLYKEIKAGRKTSEFRDMKQSWIMRLCARANWVVDSEQRQDLTEFLKVHRAWFVVGYPKRNLPRLEADITGLFLLAMQLEIKFTNVTESVVEAKP